MTREHVLAAQITAIGALSDVVLMYFDWDKKDYLKIPVREQVEVASLIGDVAEAPRASPHSIFISSSASAMGPQWRGTWAKHMFARPLKSS